MIIKFRRLTGLAIGVCTVISGLASGQTVPSQPYTWKNVTVGAGGYVPGIEFSPVKKGLCYCRTDIGSCYKWDDSAKRWIPLMDWAPVYNWMGGESLAPDPVDPNRVYMAGGMYAANANDAVMLRSDDGGKTFHVTKIPVAMGGNNEGRGVGERLAVDPNSPNILYFGSRLNGLWTSSDSSDHWERAAGFPVRGGGPNTGAGGVGLSFVVFDPSSSAKGQPCKSIYVGNTDPGPASLYHSADAGKTWQPVAGAPRKMAVHAELDQNGILYVEFASAVGPNGASGGVVMKLNTKSGAWTDISPERGNLNYAFHGLSIDRQHPGTLVVSTFAHWSPVDDVYRSTDGGATWKSLFAHSTREDSISPYLTPLSNLSPPKLGWWITALAIDPFDSDHCAYGTGATIWGTNDLTQMDSDKETHWFPWIKGIEETAIIYLASPTDGKAHLISAFGDIGGYTHDDLEVSPPMQEPKYTTGFGIDFAGKNPQIVTRNGNSGPPCWSSDGGHTWQTMSVPGGGARGRRGGGGAGAGSEGYPSVLVSGDGNSFLLPAGAALQVSDDHGSTWKSVKGLPGGLQPVADKFSPAKFYAVDQVNKKIFISEDHGTTFTSSPMEGLPAANSLGARRGGAAGSAALHVWATFDREGDLWAIGNGAMFHSADGGKNFKRISNAPTVANGLDFGLGKTADGKDYPTIFVGGTMNGVAGVWRSDDLGISWVRVTDDEHQYGCNYRCIAGDPRIYGRVYVGTDGRGILYGDIEK